MSELNNAISQIENDLVSNFDLQDVQNQLRGSGVSDDFLSSSQSFGAYVEVDLLDDISPATAVRLGSVNATAVVVFDRDLSDHRFYFTLEGAVGPTASLPLPGRAAAGVLAYTSTFDDYAGPFVGVQASAGSAVSLAIDVNPAGGFDKVIAIGYSSSLTAHAQIEPDKNHRLG